MQIASWPSCFFRGCGMGRPNRSMDHPATSSTRSSVEKRLIGTFDALPPRLQQAGRYLLDHPHEIALRSMRELAREANLAPATLTRLARQLGFAGFDELKRLYAEEIRRYAAEYRKKAVALVDIGRRGDATGLAAGIVAAIARQVDALADAQVIRSLVAGATALQAARTIYCLGQRLSFPPAYSFQYIHSIAGGSSVLLDGSGGIGLDALRRATPADAVLAISVLPYTRVTVEQAIFAYRRRIPLVVITDSEVSPLTKIAVQTIRVGTKSQSFFQTMTAVSAAAETLATMIAMGSPGAALAGLKASEQYFSDANIYWTPSGQNTGMLPNQSRGGRIGKPRTKVLEKLQQRD
jgi:DNA-binding MurR/RpiR family transcriptional regulator